jgi:hypothetical protein
MNNRLILIWLFTLWLHAAIAQKNYWQQQANYKIAVTLNDEDNTLNGFETITYYNNSPDTMYFLWVHVWPNAYKNDRTAYSEQKLLQGDSHFYFSGNDEKGYINHLDFKINGSSLVVDDHPQYIDIIKILLPTPLKPYDSVTIETPFHVKIPARFSRMGHDNQNYSLTQWYPKVALYDKAGWHEMPYLEWGEYYNDFGNYVVNITLPANYVVAATGLLQNNTELEWLKHKTSHSYATLNAGEKKKKFFAKNKETEDITPSTKQIKTLQYMANNVTDFAWFADKDFIVKYDTIILQNRIIDAWNFVLAGDEIKWKNSMAFTKNAIRFYSDQAGNYPFAQVSVVGDPAGVYSGMEYPMISILNTGNENERELDVVIAHEIGHNWFQEALATNERDHAWMDEGMNTYIENKYRRHFYGNERYDNGWITNKLPADANTFLLQNLYSKHTDQPIEGSADNYTYENYNASAYFKPAIWLGKLEKEIGSDSMLRVMHNYYETWKFRHPQPDDFKAVAEAGTNRSLDEYFNLLYTTGPPEKPIKRKIALTAFFNLSNSNKQFISIAPAIGFNNYDRFEIGLTIHNYNIPANKFQFAATPMLATGSKQLVGYAHASYDIFPAARLQKIQLYTNAARFNTYKGSGINNENVFKNYGKLTPGIYVEWKKKTAISPITTWADVRTYLISEQNLEQTPKPAPADTEYYAAISRTFTVIPQVSFGIKSERELYPWSVTAQLQQVKQIVRSSITANYFLNYNEQHDGLAVRFFFGKIFYTQTRTDLLRTQNSRYHFTMYGPNGMQDYTYSNPFAERNQSTGLFGRQIGIRDGGFKYRSDYSAIQPGLNTSGIDFFDNWIAAANFTTDIPAKINPLSILPFKVPLKVFADVGTSASPWRAGSNSSKFLYSMGLQLTIFKIITVYYPLLQSNAFKEPNSVNDPFKSSGPNWWQKRLTFSIDLAPVKQKANTFFNL